MLLFVFCAVVLEVPGKEGTTRLEVGGLIFGLRAFGVGMFTGASEGLDMIRS